MEIFTAANEEIVRGFHTLSLRIFRRAALRDTISSVSLRQTSRPLLSSVFWCMSFASPVRFRLRNRQRWCDMVTGSLSSMYLSRRVLVASSVISWYCISSAHWKRSLTSGIAPIR